MADEARKNVIVVGAGASAEFRLPTGAELVKRIEGALSFRDVMEGGMHPSSGDYLVHRAISNLSVQIGVSSHQLFEKARRIKENMSLAPSIDNFLDTHRSDKALVAVGKLVIANEILKAERGSLLKIKEGNIYNRMRFDNLQETWVSVFFKLIVAKRDFQNFKDAIKNITFISFNYDRCIKYFFVNAAISYFDLDGQQASELLAEIRVIHPYGNVGDMHMEGLQTIGFGPEVDPAGLVEISSRIRTFTEGVSDDGVASEIQKSFQDAEVVIFLGFSFIDINMEILRPDAPFARRVLATTKGRSKDTQARLFDEISRDYIDKRFRPVVDLFDGKCFELFYAFDHFLMNAQK